MACPYANFRFMGAEERDDSTVEQALAGGTRQRVGWWCFYFADEHWEWSPRSSKSTAMRPVLPEIRGPRKCFPHKHPEEHIAATLDDIRQTHKPFSTRHRIITIQGETREVVVIGERLHDNAGQVIGTQGFYIDVTPTDEARQAAIFEAVAEISDQRAVIEQVKGILIFVYHIDDNAASTYCVGAPKKPTPNCAPSLNNSWTTSANWHV